MMSNKPLIKREFILTEWDYDRCFSNIHTYGYKLDVNRQEGVFSFSIGKDLSYENNYCLNEFANLLKKMKSAMTNFIELTKLAKDNKLEDSIVNNYYNLSTDSDCELIDIAVGCPVRGPFSYPVIRFSDGREIISFEQDDINIVEGLLVGVDNCLDDIEGLMENYKGESIDEEEEELEEEFDDEENW